MDRLTGMRAFCLVAELQRFRAAADRLGLSPAMVSKHIAELESRLGIRLLNRNSRHVTLTEEGRSYFNRARALLDELEELDESMTTRSHQVRGPIRLSAPVWMANDRFAALLSEFTTRHPEVTLEIDLSARLVNLVEEGFDLALRVSDNLAPGLIARQIGDIGFGLYAAPSYLADHDAPRTLADLPGHPMLTYAGIANVERAFSSLTGQALTAPLKTIVSSESEILLHLLGRRGLGLVMLPNWLADQDHADGRLVRVLADQLDLKVGLYAVYSDRRLLPPRVRALIDFLVQQSATGRTG